VTVTLISAINVFSFLIYGILKEGSQKETLINAFLKITPVVNFSTQFYHVLFCFSNDLHVHVNVT
jgi:hypothetical protein